MATQRDPLDVIIDSLADPRHYHDSLVEDVKRLLDPNRWDRGHSSSRGKQVKRLVNMCMSTLTQWSKVHESAASPSPTVKPPGPEKVAQTISATKPAVGTAAAKISSLPRVSRATSRTDPASSVPSTSGMLTKTKPAPRTRGSGTSDRANTSLAGSKKSVMPRPSSSTPPQANPARKQKDLETPSSAEKATETLKPDIPQLPCYDHIPKLVEISFLAVGTLESMGDSVSTGLFDIEKARSNLITKTIEIGMVRSV